MRVYERRPANAKPRPRLASSKHFCQAFPNLRSCHRNTPVRIQRRGAARGDRSGGIKALRRSLPSPCFFQFCIEPFQWLGRLFLSLWPTPESLSFFRRVSRRRSATRPCTRSSGFEASETLQFPGPDSIFSSRCGAISRQLRFAASLSRRDPHDRNASVPVRRPHSPFATNHSPLFYMCNFSEG